MIDYYAYIHSEAWILRTASVRLRNGGICECCRLRFASVVHHRSYVHLGEEREEELISLCIECHACVHGKAKVKFFIWPSRLPLLEVLQNEMIKLGLYGEWKNVT